MSIKILCIDDDPIFRKLIERILNSQGYTVTTAVNGVEGVKAARKVSPDLIITDNEMPEMDGITAVKVIRQVHATTHTPIIMLTGLNTISDMQAGYDAGVDDYLTKPFKAEELVLRVEAMLRRVARIQQSVQEHETKTIGVFSLRGGAGCSSVATNLGLGLRALWESSVCLVDLSIPVGSLDILLDINSQRSVSALVDQESDNIDEDYIRQLLVEHPSGLRVMTGFKDPVDAELLTENMVAMMIDSIISNYYYTIIDLPHDFNSITLTALDRIDNLLLVFKPDMISVRQLVACLDILDRLEFPEESVRIIINWTISSGGIATPRIQEAIGRDVLLTIPHVADLWNEAINLGKPIIGGDPAHPAVQQFEELCWKFSTIADQSKTKEHYSDMRRRLTKRFAQRKKNQKE